MSDLDLSFSEWKATHIFELAGLFVELGFSAIENVLCTAGLVIGSSIISILLSSPAAKAVAAAAACALVVSATAFALAVKRCWSGSLA